MTIEKSSQSSIFYLLRFINWFFFLNFWLSLCLRVIFFLPSFLRGFFFFLFAGNRFIFFFVLFRVIFVTDCWIIPILRCKFLFFFDLRFGDTRSLNLFFNRRLLLHLATATHFFCKCIVILYQQSIDIHFRTVFLYDPFLINV